MRAAVICLVLSIVGAIAVSCAASDPDLAKPCGQRRKPPACELGIGQSAMGMENQYVLVGDGSAGPPIEVDLQQGVSWAWLGIHCRGLGPIVTVDYGINEGDAAITVPASHVRVPLSYNSSTDWDEVPGHGDLFDLKALYQIDGGPLASAALVDGGVTLWANVTDDCYIEADAAPLKIAQPVYIPTFDHTCTLGDVCEQCTGCLADACSTQLAACFQQDCFALQACLDAYCVNLSTIASPEEVLCQAWCQSQHAGAKLLHEALVACVQTKASVCQPPCSGYPIDYRHCTRLQEDPSKGSCRDTAAACAADCNCRAYGNCISGCTTAAMCQATDPTCPAATASTSGCATWADCQACVQKYPGDAGGAAKFEAHQGCLERACLLQGWIPHM
jgi:hypothetical protein